MTDQWVPAPPQPAPPDPPPGLPPANSWSPVTPCAAADAPSIADGVIITGRPAVVAAMPWQITVNDGQNPPNFSIDYYDDSGALLEHPIYIAGANGAVTLTQDPVQPLGVATKQYVDNTGLREAPTDGTTYGRNNAAWLALPSSYMPEAPNTSQRYGRFNSVWQLDAIQTDAPSDGTAYARQSGAWTAAVTGGPYLPLTGGTISGNLTVNQVLTVNGSNSLVLNAAGGNLRAILGMTSNLARWALNLGDGTAEGLGNVGSNFSLSAYSNTASYLGTWLSIARADGSAAFAGPVNMNGGAAVNGTLALQGPSSFYLPGGAAGQVLSTNGAGALSWATRLADAPSDGQFYTRQNAAWAIAPGGMTDAPNDGTAYARKSAAWAHLTHTDITDWTATLAPYALITSVPIASSTTPAMDGTAAVGTSLAYARGDHVHPTDTSRAAASSLANYLLLTGGTLTGALGGTSAAFTGNGSFGGSLALGSFLAVSTPTATAHSLFGQTAGSTRWNLRMGNGLTESGSNVGADLDFVAYADNGSTVLSAPLTMKRSTGVCTFSIAIVNGPSDRTLKENIEPIENALDKVMALQGVSFNMIATPDRPEIGLIAQDVEPVVPEIIQTYTHTEDGKTTGDKLALDYPKLTALLIEAVKTLTARVAALEVASNG